VKYVLMICGEESDAPIPPQDDAIPECVAWAEEMRRRGVLRDLIGMRASGDATTVRVRGHEVLLTDGPFAETKDQIGGFGVIECADLDEAVDVASRHPMARFGMIEVRPVWEG
jgi:hypothetical protein